MYPASELDMRLDDSLQVALLPERLAASNKELAVNSTSSLGSGPASSVESGSTPAVLAAEIEARKKASEATAAKVKADQAKLDAEQAKVDEQRAKTNEDEETIKSLLEQQKVAEDLLAQQTAASAAADKLVRACVRVCVCVRPPATVPAACH